VLYLMDQGSQMAGRLAARAGTVLDACAAPGGKAMLMADLAGGDGRVVACDVAGGRVSELEHRVRRWGCPNVHVVRADAGRPPFRGPFDAVLLDAPCSGLGTIGRHPDIRWKVRPQDLEVQSRRQQALLSALAPLVRPGGALVYSTCSSEPEENEQPVQAFLAADTRFALGAAPDWAGPFAEPPYLRTRPERDRGDAFFAAVLERRH
jgi:16S rRNA (cytosine967-C5)-methyltransferase